MAKTSRALVNLLVQLTVDQPWAKGRLLQIEELLDECEDESEQALVCSLIKKFTYLDSNRHDTVLSLVVSQICEKWPIDPATGIIAAVSPDRYPDSGNFVAHEVRTKLKEKGWKSDRVLARYDRIPQEESKPSAMVLIDEFVGSGATFESRLKTIRERTKNKGWGEIPAYATAYAGMRFSRQRLIDAGFVDVFFGAELLKGISEQSDASKMAEDIVLMQAMEARLEEVVDDNELPSFGYGQCEALYWRDRANIPNSVFPVFWWPERKVRKLRKVVFTRA